MTEIKKKIATLLIGAILSFAAYGDEVEQRRLTASLAIFPRIVAVDMGLKNKLTLDNKINLVLVFKHAAGLAEESAKTIASAVPNIGGMDVTVSAVPLDEIAKLEQLTAGMFVVEKLDDEDFRSAVSQARQRHVILFSPFAGDVERGAAAGIAVTSKILPYFNLSSLRDAGIVINQVLLSISKTYE